MMNPDFPPQSRLWLYLSNRKLTDAEVNEINISLINFCNKWNAHGSQLRAGGDVLHHRFIRLMVDQTAAGASGCSIDKSVHFIQQIEIKYGVELFNRMIFARREKEQILTGNLNEIQKLFDEGIINPETIVFDTLVNSKKDFDDRFEIPLSKSWMFRQIKGEKILL